MDYEAVIGLEVHVQLNTKTKIFCQCSTQFGSEANTQTCPVCQGHPGVLPVLNEEVLNKAVLAGLALNCKINQFSKFDRKNYFYPDLPKAYQISQYDLPICGLGHLEVVKSGGEKVRIGVTRIHMEEDAGKLIHSEIKGINESYVDLNRTGTPLLEVVSEPDIRDGEEAVLYLSKLRQIMKFLEVSDVNMEEGSLRCDVNISLRPRGEKQLGTKAEIKNLNSFKSIQKAIDYEIERQAELLRNGELVIQETRLFDPDTNETRSMRRKEEAMDYRYFPDPDLVPMVITDQMLEEIKNSMPELPETIEKRFEEEYGVKPDDAKILTSEKEYAEFFDKAARKKREYAQKMANFILSDVLGNLKEMGISFKNMKLNPVHLSTLFDLIEKGEISLKIAKQILPDILKTGEEVEKIVEAKGLKQISDTSELETIVSDIVEKHPNSIQEYREGKTKVIGFFVGQVMKATGGKANPQMVNQLIRKKLDSLK
jgi:aspartyl-tRNA(Asn)/glutamyl-tRNA(Gln) amidotransferase subunit B